MADKVDTKGTSKIEGKSKVKKAKDGSSTPKSNSRPNSRTVSRDNTPKPNTTPKTSREGTPKPNTPKTSRGNTPKPLTPKPMPKYQYDKDELLKFRKSPLSSTIPVCLDKYKDILPDIILNEPLKNLDVQVRDSQTGDITVIRFEDDIDPDHWYKHIHIPRDDSRGNSPLTLSGLRPLERKPRHENDTLFKRKDPSRDDEDGGGIVLGPQRKSFDTGCHVSALGKDGLRGDRTNTRRIGSGRIAMRHDSLDEERGAGRRELPQLEQLRKEAGRGRRGGFVDRSFTNRRDYEYRDREYDRDFGDRRYGQRREYRRHDSEPEDPEWFTAGPTSQLDTIELRGFEDPKRNESRRNEEEEEMQEEEEYEANDESHEQENGEKTEGCVSVADRNGSLETNESSSPETSHDESKANTTAAEIVEDKIPTSAHAQFDFNDLFNIDNIPGLSNIIAESEIVSQVGAGGSRFSQWFQGSSNTPVGSRGPASRSNSRRSSITEEFSYLHELINGSKSPALASPEPDDPTLGVRASPHDRRALIGASPAEKLFSAHPAIMQLLNGVGAQQRIGHVQHAQQMANMHGTPKHVPQGALNVSDVEASLKSLILAGAKRTNPDSAQQSNIPHPVVPSGGRVMTAEELEASLTGRTNTADSNPRPHDHRLSSDRDTREPNSLTSHYIDSAVLSAQSRAPLRQFELQSNSNNALLSRDTDSQSQSAFARNLFNPDIGTQTRLNSVTSHTSSTPQSFANTPLAISSSHNSYSSTVSAPSSTAILGSHGGNRVTTVAELEAGLKERAVAAAMAEHLGEPPNEMAAFNRLLGMVKASQTPGSRPQQMLQQPTQQQLQAQATKQLQMKHLQQQQQQQQQNMLKQLINQAAATNAQPPIVPRQPGMVKSPIPPPLNLQAPAVQARAPSPLIAPTSPRAPSPIMFGSQPPMHLTAPSPIHAASQIPRSPSPNTLQVTPSATRRVPSPQELHTHAQAIMQNALIKKQLEGQKQRFMQKQQANKSPSPSVEKSIAEGVIISQTPQTSNPDVRATATSSANNMTSTPATTMAGINPAFTPTSVIRKMANDKMEEKEKHEQDEQNADKSAPVMKLTSRADVISAHDASVISSGNISITVPNVPHNQHADSMAQNELSRLQAQFQVTMEHLQSGKPLPHHLQSTQPSQPASQKAPRPLVGQGAMNNSLTHPSPVSQSQHSNQHNTPVAMQLNQTPQSVGMSQLSNQTPPQGVATTPGALSNQTPPTPQQLAQMQHQHMLATSQAMALHGAHMMNPISQAMNNQSVTTSHGRPIVKAVQSSVVNTISPPSNRPIVTTAMPQQTPKSEQPVANQTPQTPSLPTAHIPGQPMSAGPAVPNHRPIVGGGGAKGGGQVLQDSVRLAEQARLAQIQAQLQAQAGAHINKGSPYAAVNVSGGRVPVQMAGLLPVQLTAQQQQQAAVANAILMQRMMIPQNPQAGLHPQQLAALQAAQLSQQQQRTLDNRAARSNPAYPPPTSAPQFTPGARGIHGQGAGAQGQPVGRSVSPQQQVQMMANMQAKRDGAMGRPGMAQGGDGLAKFFGTDLLKQQLGAMPPLPNQGQSIMTVEEIERRQQTVTN